MNKCIIFSVHRAGTHRPLGPHRICTFLRQEGWDAEVVDYSYYFTLDELKSLVENRMDENIKFFGFGAWFGTWPDEIVTFTVWLKETYPHIPLVYGSMSSPHTRESPIDYYSVGYGEESILEIVKDILGKPCNLKFSPRWKGKEVIDANEDYPAWPRKTYAAYYEDRDFLEEWEWLTIELSRGCKFKCQFCNFPILGIKEDHSISAENFRKQIEDAYNRFGITNYYIADETINQDKEMMRKFANVANTWDFKLQAHGFMRADLMIAQPDTWQMMVDTGITGHHYGIETFNRKSGATIGKGMKTEKLQEGLIKIKDYFRANSIYRGHISMIVGLPYESKETFWKGVDWLKENWAGEFSAFNRLEIPLPTGNAKLSLFTRSWKDMGYRDRKTKLQSGTEQKKLLTMGGGMFTEDLLDWENDYMDIEWAIWAMGEAYRVLKPTNGVGSWHFSDYSLLLKNDNRAISKIIKSDLHHNQNGVVDAFYERYKKKKIAWGT